MKNYPYLERLAGANHTEKVRFASLVARRALEGGDVDQLFDICKIAGIKSTVLHVMGTEYDGCMLLHLRLWLDRYTAYEIGDFSDWFSKYERADDSDDCIDHMTDKGLITRCEDCNEWELSHHVRSYYGNDSAEICRNCIENNYRWSEYYDDYIYLESARDAHDQYGNRCVVHEDDDDFEYNDDDDEYYHVDYSPASRVIGNYHSSKHSQRPQPSPWTRMKKRYLGVELEVEVRDNDRSDKALALHKLINNEQFGDKVFFENDGSLNNGFEIISQPMGMDKHRDLWAWLKDKDAVRSLRSHNTTTCGLHVHVSKDGLSKLQIAKIVSFINDPDNEPLIRAVARRYAEGYCRIKVKKIGQAAQSDDRYEAVNITPRKTIEFRIFKGSLKYESVMAAIQFSNAVVDFCSRSTTSIRELKADKFLDFIRDDETGDNDVLVTYLENRLETA